jgi:hypothetical protein
MIDVVPLRLAFKHVKDATHDEHALWPWLEQAQLLTVATLLLLQL